MSERAEVASLVAAFRGTGAVVSVEQNEQGHINTTWFVTCTNGRYVLQRINPHVFTNPRGVVRNVAAVCAHAAAKHLVPRVCVAKSGEPWAEDHGGGVWRLCTHVAGRSAAFLTDTAMARSAGHAFGALQRALADFAPARLETAIPHFHDLGWRFRRLDEVLGVPPRPHRQARVAKELEFLATRRGLAAAGAASLGGVIHGDCKVNNLIFHPQHHDVLAVVDLDTVMAGSRAWDFGDLVRSAATTGAEDDPRAEISVEMFRAIAHGFVAALGDLLDNAARTELVTACRYMTLMLGLRFLIDYLEGDVYFRAAHDEHNLERARAQFGIVLSLERRERELLSALSEV